MKERNLWVEVARSVRAGALVLQRTRTLLSDVVEQRRTRQAFSIFEYFELRSYLRHAVARARNQVPTDDRQNPLELRALERLERMQGELDEREHRLIASGALTVEGIAQALAEQSIERDIGPHVERLRALRDADKPLVPLLISHSTLRAIEDAVIDRVALRLVWHEARERLQLLPRSLLPDELTNALERASRRTREHDAELTVLWAAGGLLQKTREALLRPFFELPTGSPRFLGLEHLPWASRPAEAAAEALF